MIEVFHDYENTIGVSILLFANGCKQIAKSSLVLASNGMYMAVTITVVKSLGM